MKEFLSIVLLGFDINALAPLLVLLCVYVVAKIAVIAPKQLVAVFQHEYPKHQAIYSC